LATPSFLQSNIDPQSFCACSGGSFLRGHPSRNEGHRGKVAREGGGRVPGIFPAFFRAPSGEACAIRLKMAITFALRAALWQFAGRHP